MTASTASEENEQHRRERTALIQISPIEVLDSDTRSRREFDPNFLSTGYRRRVWISSDPEMTWKRPPCRTLCPLTLVPILVGEETRVQLRVLNGEGSIESIETEPGRYYSIPANSVYQIETRGVGVLEIYTPVSSDSRCLDEQMLPADYFERHNGVP